MGRLSGEKCPYCEKEAAFPDPGTDMSVCFNCGRKFSNKVQTRSETKPKKTLLPWRR